MRKAVILLSFTTLLFAASTLYLALQLHARDAAAPRVAADQTTPPSLLDTRLAATPAALTSGMPAVDSRRAEHDRANPADQNDYRAQFRRDLADPVKRAALIQQAAAMRRAGEPRLAAYVGLNDAEADTLFALLAEQQLASQERFMECKRLPCLSPEHLEELTERNRAGIVELIGAERAARHDNYELTRSERVAADKLRADLPDKLRMTDDQYENLITALAEERRAFEREATARGLDTRSAGAPYGMLYWDENQRTLEERLAAAREYSKRLQTRASTVLDAGQLREYSRTQEAGLANLASFLPYQDSMAANGIPGSTPTH